ncbi:MAG: pentapeptide repeat-containing protein [Myxococcota bacterium]
MSESESVTKSVGFVPSQHGFRFANAFDDTRVSGAQPEPWTVTIDGRAGGMVYAALDWWHVDGEGFPAEAECPPPGDVLAALLARRQHDASAGVAAELVMAARVGGVAEQLAAACHPHGQAFAELVSALDADRPVPLGLLDRQRGCGHQVLAIGYEGPATLILYDPNHPGAWVTLRWKNEGGGWVHGVETVQSRAEYDAWFLDRGYTPVVPTLRPPGGPVEDLSHRDLRQWEPPGVDLQNLCLVGADLREHAGLGGRDLQSVDARGALFEGATLTRCDLRDCDLRDAVFSGADLGESTFDRSKMSGANLRGARCGGARFRRIDAGEGLIANAARFVGDEFLEAVLDDASFREASFGGCDFRRSRLCRARFRGARIEDTEFTDVDAPAVSFADAHLTEVGFEGGACLRGADFSRATIRGGRFVGADLRDASFNNATLIDVDFSFADLRGTTWHNARIEGGTLTGVAWPGSAWIGAHVGRCRLDHHVLMHLRGSGAEVRLGPLAFRSSRVQIGGPVREIYGGPFGLFATRSGGRDLWRWEGQPHRWTRVGDGGHGFVSTADALFGLSERDGRVLRFDGEHWTELGGPARRLHAGGLGVFMESAGTGELLRLHDDTGAWERIAGPGADFAVTDVELFRVSSSRERVEQHVEGDEWEAIGGPATALHAGPRGLFATRPGTGEVWRWERQPDEWTRATEAAAEVVVTREHLYRLLPGRDRVVRGAGSASLPVGGPMDQLVACGESLFGVAHRTADVWQLV